MISVGLGLLPVHLLLRTVLLLLHGLYHLFGSVGRYFRRGLPVVIVPVVLIVLAVPIIPVILLLIVPIFILIAVVTVLISFVIPVPVIVVLALAVLVLILILLVFVVLVLIVVPASAAALLVAAFYGETAGPLALAGAAVVITGVVGYNVLRARG